MPRREGTTASGKPIADCFCPLCDEYSGGGICRVCQREIDAGLRPPPQPKLFPETAA